MAKSKETTGKKDKEKKKQQKKKEKIARAEDRKANSSKGKGLEEMFAFVDENGNLSDTPPDLTNKKDIALEDIQLGAAKVDPEEDGLRKGIVNFFNHDKGYGFINDLRSQKSIFVHQNDLSEPIKERDKVSFEIKHEAKGLAAFNVKKIK
ncbi:MAG: cold shock domain-containing protein [Sphingobacteriales bacterium]|nr:MAG: cold shock domain-containing protein [Sphingobacteriales bacterium]